MKDQTFSVDRHIFHTEILSYSSYFQAPVVQRVDNFIHWIGCYAANKCVQEFP